MGILEDLRWIDLPSNNLFIINDIIDFSSPKDHWYKEFQKNKSLIRSSKYINHLCINLHLLYRYLMKKKTY